MVLVADDCLLNPLYCSAIKTLFEVTRGVRPSPTHERPTPPIANGAAVPGPVFLRAEGSSGVSAPGSTPLDIGSSGNPTARRDTHGGVKCLGPRFLGRRSPAC